MIDHEAAAKTVLIPLTIGWVFLMAILVALRPKRPRRTRLEIRVENSRGHAIDIVVTGQRGEDVAELLAGVVDRVADGGTVTTPAGRDVRAPVPAT